MVQSMFPSSQKLSGAPEEKHQSYTPSTVLRVPFPPKFNRPLPVPDRALVGSSDPNLKPTVAYAVVGPRIRGKFDGRKAVELGLPPGPLRAKLVKGENVTVQVKDNNGNVVNREIRPEDCIGESLTPAVSHVLFFG